jgi:hypothetical protein
MGHCMHVGGIFFVFFIIAPLGSQVVTTIQKKLLGWLFGKLPKITSSFFHPKGVVEVV